MRSAVWTEDELKRARVGVIYGGSSDEREVSLKTGAALANALREAGYEQVIEYDLPGALDALLEERPVAVLLGLHGGAGEDGTMQGFLEVLKIPYTGSGVRASAVAMDKSSAKAVIGAAGGRVARSVLVSAEVLADASRFSEVVEVARLRVPLVLKPNDSGSSCGLYICRDGEALEAGRVGLAALGVRGIVEELIEGDEFSVGFFDGECLGAMRIVPASGVYDYHAKYQVNTTRYEILEAGEELDALAAQARVAWEALGCSGVGRVDLMGRLGPSGFDGYVLEVNTLPGMTQTSIIPKLAARRGWSFAQLASRMIVAARLERG